MSKKCFLIAGLAAGAASIAATSAIAAPITFSSAADYDNAASQVTGFFRDFLDGSEISQGLDLGGTGHTALNFSGSDSIGTAAKGRITLYDTTPATSAPTLFTGNMNMSADILISEFNNAKGGGLLTLFNEGAGNKGLALFVSDAGNTDNLTLRLVEQTGITGASFLATTNLNGGIAEDNWYRLTLGLVFTGGDFTITGQVFRHITGTDPNSALGTQVGTTLSYTDTGPTWSAGLLTPYQIGLVARGNAATVDTSITNFDENGEPIPEPSTILLFGAGLLGLSALRRRRDPATQI